MRAEISPKAHERYEEIVRVYLLPTLGNVRLQKLAATKKPDAGNPHVRFDERGGETGLAPTA